MTTLIDAFNEGTVDGLMCRHQISIDPRGRLYDCDFNLMLGLALPADKARPQTTIWDVPSLDHLSGTAIATASGIVQ